MEIKWLMIGFAIVMSAVVIGETVQDLGRTQCRVAAVEAHMTPEQIAQVCK